MNRFQEGGHRLGIKDTLTIPSIAGMLYPDSGRGIRLYRLSQEATAIAKFGDNLKKKFPTAAVEVEQAAGCYAQGFGTACVFHLMRAAEVGLNAVWASLTSASPGEAGVNWGGILGEIETEIGKRRLDPQEERFFRFVRGSLSTIKDSFRNPTMHNEYIYPPHEAEKIFISVRSLMDTIASRLNEEGKRC
jgi:hypothetical protein